MVLGRAGDIYRRLSIAMTDAKAAAAMVYRLRGKNALGIYSIMDK